MRFKDKSRSTENKLVNGCPQDLDFNPEIHEFKSAFVTAKARVTPLDK